MNSCLDCLVSEIIFSTHIYIINRSQPSLGIGTAFILALYVTVSAINILR